MSDEGPCVRPRFGSSTPSASEAPGVAFSGDCPLTLSSARLHKNATSSQRERSASPHLRPWLEQSEGDESPSRPGIVAVPDYWKKFDPVRYLLQNSRLWWSFLHTFPTWGIPSSSECPDLSILVQMPMASLYNARPTSEDETMDICLLSCCSYLRRQASSYNGPVGTVAREGVG